MFLPRPTFQSPYYLRQSQLPVQPRAYALAYPPQFPYGLPPTPHFRSYPSLRNTVKPPHHIESKLSGSDAAILNAFIESQRHNWQSLKSGDVRRYAKANYHIPRTIEVFRDSEGRLRIMVLCKTKISAELPDSTCLTTLKDKTRTIGIGAYKVVKFALDWDENKLYTNLVMHFTKDEMKQFPRLAGNLKKSIQIANQFAGKTGFPGSCIGMHEYTTKNDQYGNPILNIGYFMPYFSHRSLDQNINAILFNQKNIPLDMPDRLNYFLDIASALKSLKEKNVVHNDINPANILVDQDQDGKYHLLLTDFDFAYDLSQESRIDLGTYDYESPERIFNYKTFSKPNRSDAEDSPYCHDIWSAGLSYLALLCAKDSDLLDLFKSFMKKRRSELEGMEILTFVQSRETYLGSVNAEVDALFANLHEKLKDRNAAFELDLIRRMLEADPAKRYTAEELYKTLVEKKEHL